MQLSTTQILSDRDKMIAYICRRIQQPECRVVLASGEDGTAWADLTPLWDDELGWDLRFDTNLPEWVTLAQIYEHFREQDMTSWEWKQSLDATLSRQKLRDLEDELSILRGQVQCRKPEVVRERRATPMPDVGDLPPELSTAQVAQILGISKDTVLKLKTEGLLEYRNAAPPSSSRPIFVFALSSVLALRTTYQTDEPILRRKPDPPRRKGKSPGGYKHLRLSGD